MGNRRRIKDHLDSYNSRPVWQGVQHLANYRTDDSTAEGKPSLAEELNYYFACFEVEKPDAATLPIYI